MNRDITLNEDDSTIFSKCLVCDRRGKGIKVGLAYHRAFTRRKWSQGPKCENCDGSLTKLYEIE